MTKIVPASSVECLVRSRDQLGETPLWCEQSRKLWWLDIEKPKLQSYDPSADFHEIMPMRGITFLGSQALTTSGQHLLAHDLDLVLQAADGGPPSLFARVEHGLDNRLNDGRVDRQGRLWIGTMDNQLHRPAGALYRVDPSGEATRILGDVVVSNGIAFSPDGRRFHFTDTRRHKSWVFDMDPDDGVLSNQRLFADYSATGDRPDGACFDADGGLWTAFFAGSRVVRYSPDGRIDTVIELPVTNPTCVCFGGDDLRTLIVTTARKFLPEETLETEALAGSVLAIHGLAEGLPENRFAA
ncbi:SMP-30/gluconolactonase/LRE family protein [Rhizobium sp. SSA_523]|uniref:SMP-30/gluconolactonase/LRE family protein n=1 Tax=Rhizobium sp. SSA_523 TaxID=2952477 RepID=UPI00208FFFF1|nr:SMP-30/gluconolactonase/LRE family protein [Rhizobium sp. SSA_523]MCO5731226.1 SMP-30/gluconolactonase/LRE family protein [Rhizobium sp. SSA_523]WKC22234.1 SMP-30/gluconolactonase/LRE family protein [Rhizobium sp. SSA_523]